ncbi:ABC transporter ATP-binding protein [Roseovarius albus]|nr:ABC transporter ATP-binding protein [Roseovarius albus]
MGFTSIDGFLIALGCGVFAMILISAVLRSVAVYAINRWVMSREYSLSRRLLDVYMRQPYAFFLDRHTGDLSTYILSETHRVVGDAYKPAADILNSLVTFVFIVSLLLWTEPMMTLVSVAVLGGCYLVLFTILKPLIKRMGEAVVKSNKARFRIAGEALGGVKQIRLLGRERNYISAYSDPARTQARVRAANATLRQVPKFALEVIAFGGIVVLTLFLVTRSGGVEGDAIAKSLPLLGLYAFAGYRLLPTMQIIYASAATLRYGSAAVEAVYKDLGKGRSLARLPSEQAKPLPLNQRLELLSVSYKYPGAKTEGLSDINICIERGMTVGLVGSTGAGKTTLIDVLLGLLTPTGGEMLVDGVALTSDNIRSWQANVGYVPQEIFLTDSTIAQNIAMGVPVDQISMKRVEQACRMAQIYDFVVDELPNGFETAVGERGVRLSGGQRQRIGIARALYNNPEVIVFDEATSALDNATEREVMNEISALSGSKTIIMIAHRLTTIEKSDKVIVLDQGRVVGDGTFSELSKKNTYFQNIENGSS